MNRLTARERLQVSSPNYRALRSCYSRVHWSVVLRRTRMSHLTSVHSNCSYAAETGWPIWALNLLIWAKNNIQLDILNHRKIVFRDEAYYWLNSYFSKQNYRIWSGENSEGFVETSFHALKVTVWCVSWAARIIGPQFFKDDPGWNVVVNTILFPSWMVLMWQSLLRKILN